MKQWFAADSLVSCKHHQCYHSVWLTALYPLYQLEATVQTQAEEVEALPQQRMQLPALWLLQCDAEINEFKT